mgnify:CR=1 FL=1
MVLDLCRALRDPRDRRALIEMAVEGDGIYLSSQMAAELTTLKHSALWNDRELGNKVQLLTREVEVMNGQLQAKESALQRSQEQEIHLKGVCEELKGQAEAMAAEMRQKMKELSGENEKKLETMPKFLKM